MLTQKQLHSILEYDAETGIFTWKQRVLSTFNHNLDWLRRSWNTKFAGKVAGCVQPSGYITIGINGKGYDAHRLAYLHQEGYFPVEVDHKDLNKSNNAFSNLRATDRSKNKGNIPVGKLNTSGFKGVSFCKQRGLWISRIRDKRAGVTSCGGGKRRMLGRFATPEQAAEAYDKAAIEVFGEFALTNKAMGLL